MNGSRIGAAAISWTIACGVLVGGAGGLGIAVAAAAPSKNGGGQGGGHGSGSGGDNDGRKNAGPHMRSERDRGGKPGGGSGKGGKPGGSNGGPSGHPSKPDGPPKGEGPKGNHGHGHGKPDGGDCGNNGGGKPPDTGGRPPEPDDGGGGEPGKPPGNPGPSVPSIPTSPNGGGGGGITPPDLPALAPPVVSATGVVASQAGSALASAPISVPLVLVPPPINIAVRAVPPPAAPAPAPPPRVAPLENVPTGDRFPAGRDRLPSGIGSTTSGLPENFRAGYPQYLRNAQMIEVAGLALPGVLGIFALTAAGGLVGYRQAKASHMVRAAGTARFLH